MNLKPSICGNDAIYIPAEDPCEGACTLQEKTFTENGTYTPDTGYDGMSSVTVNVEGIADANTMYMGTSDPSNSLGEDGDIYYKTATENDVEYISATYYKINGEWVNGTSLGTKTITQNGTYTASDDSLDGYSSVEVNVSGSITPESVLSGTMTLNANGINFTERSIANDIGCIKGTEYSAGFEGFNVQFDNLTAGKTYICVFNWQTISGSYFFSEWMYGYKISNSAVSSYNVSSGTSGWNPMVRDLTKHAYAITFTPSSTTAYLVFALPGYSDDSDNAFELTNLMVIAPANL